MTKYDVWSDGSYREKKGVGAGWVVRHNDNEVEGSTSISKLEEHEGLHGSDISEILAFQCALSTIPDGSIVDARMDCQNVLDWLKEGCIKNKKKLAVPLLMNHFDIAMERINAMQRVNLIKVSSASKNNTAHDRTHVLSRSPSPEYIYPN